MWEIYESLGALYFFFIKNNHFFGDRHNVGDLLFLKVSSRVSLAVKVDHKVEKFENHRPKPIILFFRFIGYMLRVSCLFLFFL